MPTKGSHRLLALLAEAVTHTVLLDTVGVRVDHLHMSTEVRDERAGVDITVGKLQRDRVVVVPQPCHHVPVHLICGAEVGDELVPGRLHVLDGILPLGTLYVLSTLRFLRSYGHELNGVVVRVY